MKQKIKAPGNNLILRSLLSIDVMIAYNGQNLKEKLDFFISGKIKDLFENFL